ncbi:DUF3459 domain-containing protein [Dactylosporangium sp. CA-092794]|uniref:DUF3459 domain-containing protein n=1 Tax=Dactylosporangium sp. CA-092794 TaxID=3239929 RepID=UPI003D90B545
MPPRRACEPSWTSSRTTSPTSTPGSRRRSRPAFTRGDIACVVNFGAEPASLPQHSAVLLASGDLPDGRLPTDTAVWLRL